MEEFVKELNSFLNNAPRHELLRVKLDFNAKIGADGCCREFLGNHGLEERSEIRSS